MKNTASYLRLLLRDGEARRGAVSFIGMLFNSAYAVWCLIVGILFSNSLLIAVAAF